MFKGIDRNRDYEKHFVVDEADHKKIVKSVDGSIRVIDLYSDIKGSGKGPESILKGGNGMDFPQLDALNLEAQESTKVDDLKKTAVKVAFIGAGQGGCKIADEFWDQGYRRVLLVNTTDQDMVGLQCPNKKIFGVSNIGTGKNPEIGRKFAEEYREDILRACKKHFGNDTELVIICTGAGGGSGSGSTPVLIDVAKQFLASIGQPEGHVGVVAAFPKKSEGQSVMNNAQALMGKLIDRVDGKLISPLIVVDNDKIGKLFPKASITEFYKIANKNIAGLFNVFNELSSQSSPYSTLDPADLKSVLYSGVIVFGMTPITNMNDETAIAAAIEKNIKGGLLSEEFSLKGATHAGAILVATKAKMATIPQGSFDMAFETLQRVMGGKDLVLHSGIYEAPDELGDRCMLYTIAGGLK